MKRIVALAPQILLAVFLVSASASPASASSFTLDSTNCSTATACFGLSWTLTINAGSFLYGSNTYGYQALLTVADDPFSSINTSNVVISAVNFKVSNSMSSAVLYSVPSSTVLSTWATSVGSLSSSGCGTNSGGFACSQSATDPANFNASTAQTFGWYFNSGTLFSGLSGSHIGAKMVALGTPGKLLSQSYTPPVQVPEPSTLLLLSSGLAFVAYRRRRQS